MEALEVETRVATGVLVVDDTPVNLRLIEGMLGGSGLEVVTAASGSEAVARAAEREFAVIILDVRMQPMDGYETAVEIRRREQGRRPTPIIFVTAEYQNEVQIRKGYMVGAVDYLLKPIVREILVAKVAFFVELFEKTRRLHAQAVHEQQLAAIRRELEFARDIQRSILPRSFSYPGVAIYADIRTAREVGGDFYDFNTCHAGGDERLCAIIGDVMGKGMPAALVMVMTLTVLRETSRLTGSPAEILARSNGIIYERTLAMQTSNAVTAACISLDVPGKRLYYAKAGHDEILVWSARTRTVRTLDCRGYFLGAFEEGVYEELEVPLEAGDKIILYTDGITEARNREREFFGQERLIAMVDALGHESPPLLGAHILEAVDEFQGYVARDDTALLILEMQ